MENAKETNRQDYYRKYDRDHRLDRRQKARDRHRGRIKKVSGLVLTAARGDACYEANRGITDYVVCRVADCGAKMKLLTSRHLRSYHGLTIRQYKRQFPGAPTASTARRQKLRAARPNMRLGRAHRGQTPTKYWDVATLLVEGKAATEIGRSIGRGSMRVKVIGRKLGLSARPSRYDLGMRLTRAQLAKLQDATGLDGPSFARYFGVAPWLTHGKNHRANQLLSPNHALAMIAARDKIIGDVYRLARNKGRGRYTGSSPKVLNSLVPHFPQAIAALRQLLAVIKARGDHDWRDWVCQQAPMNHGAISVLPLAIELSPWIEQRLGEVQTRQNLWRLAVEILASRFGVSSSVASEKTARVRPREMERLILRIDNAKAATPPVAPGEAAARKGKGVGGRKKGSLAKETPGRIELVAAIVRLKKDLAPVASLVSPDSPHSPKSNAYVFKHRHNNAIRIRADKMSETEAEQILQKALQGPRPLQQ